MSKREVGHNFLARLGKKRLRPGGVEATNWLINQAQFTSEMNVLEVACNMATTSIELAKEYKVHITGVDVERQALDKARVNIEEAGLTDYIQVQQGNAMKLPFPDNTFDIVINEAMLTMLPESAKKKAVAEYYRVLKPGGKLLTHDITYLDPTMESKLEQLSDSINMKVSPLYLTDWQALYEDTGFSNVIYQSGKMTLMSVSGMIKDEGFINTVKIAMRGRKKENRAMFNKMFQFFNHEGKDLQYIAVCSKK